MILTFATETTDWISAVAALFAVIFAAGGVAYAGRQLNASRRTTKGQFLLVLEDQLQHHAKVHVALLPGGIWTLTGSGPSTPEEWAEVVGYLGLFERMNALRRAGTLSLSDIQRFYSYRLFKRQDSNKNPGEPDRMERPYRTVWETKAQMNP